jgi:SAM-dependent methyltransferase
VKILKEPLHESEFLARQREHFARADVEHYRWQTRGPGFSDREASFLEQVMPRAAAPLLEVGAGEGGNLHHLLAAGRVGSRPVGIDAFVDKLRFAARELPGARFAAADAARLPFRDGSFGTVLIRDVLHHLPDPRATVVEATRVLAPGGDLVLVEPNARSPLIRLQMAVVPAERGAARSDPAWLRALLDGLPLEDLAVEMAAPLPVDRVILHHRFGIPALGTKPAALRALAAIETASARLLPRSRWSYVILRARRSRPRPS